MDALTHIDEAGRARMVDVSGKPVVERYARAKGAIRLAASTIELIRRDEIAKGNVLVTAELAGVQAAKQTPAAVEPYPGCGRTHGDRR
jgi:cyclic pyranopterin phosphate synthase